MNDDVLTFRWQRRSSSWRRAVIVRWFALAAIMAGPIGASPPVNAGETPHFDAAAIEFFEKSVRPILVKHCYECHSAGDANGGLALDSRLGVLQGGDSGAAVTAGYPAKSRLIEAVRYQNADLQMPPKNRLSAAEIATLEKWITLGLPDPREPVIAATAAQPVGMSIEEGRNFWSFRPLSHPDVPAVKNAAWVQTPLDAFILPPLEADGLQPAPQADKRTLLRRVTFDLTGLPPTVEDIDSFLQDESPVALGRVVDRLLESPDYGVRWGRHWLDVARYADSNGLDENLAFGNAWRYRDYVVDAFQQDKPFDRFLVEQIAGDLLPAADQQTKTATSFLALGAKVLAEPDREKLVMDTIDEQLDTVGKAFLGMTLGCVRCHDHKFDPIKQTDYYGLAAIFKSTRTLEDQQKGSIKRWHEHSFADDDDRARLKKIDDAIAEKKRAAGAIKNSAVGKLRKEARAQATAYLQAATRCEPTMSVAQVVAVAEPLGLNAHVLHHCRLFLEYHQSNAFFRAWHDLAAADDVDGIERHYAPQFAEVETAWAAAKKADPKVTKLTDPQLEQARAALDDPAGFLAVPSKAELVLDAASLAIFYQRSEEARLVESVAPDLPGAMGVTEGDVLTSLPIHIRGSHRNLGPQVSRTFPEVMQTSTGGAPLPSKQSGRLELAQWMADARHPLTARVYVNRVWRWHFGVGLVTSTDNFGRLGDRPSHPELLDWLATHFIESGWSTKALHRLILSSSVYQMASRHPQEAASLSIDPENRRLWKFRIERLEAEEIRDAVLAVTGRLDRSLGGKTVPLRNRQFVFDHTSIDHTKYDSLRRAIYLPVIRNNLYPLFEQFDFPDPTMPTGSRNSTIVATQALLLLNADLIIDSAEAWARHLLDTFDNDSQRVAAAYESAFARPPTTTEAARALAFVQQTTQSESLPPSDVNLAPPEQRTWALFCQSLLASNEFIYLR